MLAAICRIRSGGQIVGREEGLQRQFRQRDVDRRAEHHGGRDEAQHLAIVAQLEGDRDIVGRQRSRARRDRIGLQVVIELDQLGIGGGLALAVQPLQQMRGPFGEIDGARRQRLGVKGQPQDVEGLPEQALRNAFEQRRHHAVGRHQIPVPVIGQRRIGLVRLQHQIDRLHAPISARDHRAIAAERPARSQPRPAARCVRARAPPAVRPVSSTISRDGAARPVSTKLR